MEQKNTKELMVMLGSQDTEDNLARANGVWVYFEKG